MGKENESMMEIDELLIKLLEENEFNILGYEDGCIELQRYTPADEDWIITLYFDGTLSGFCNAIDEFYEGFDVDEEVELFVEVRGQRGVPSSIRTLLEDQEWKEEQLKLLNEAASDLNSAAIEKTRLGEIDTVRLEKAILLANKLEPEEGLTAWDELFVAGTRAYVDYAMSEDAATHFRRAWEARADAFWDDLTPQRKADALAELEAAHFSSDFFHQEKDFLDRMIENIDKASRSSLFGTHAED